MQFYTLTTLYYFAVAAEQEAIIQVDDIIWGDSSDSNANTEDMDYQQPRPGTPGCSYHEDAVTLTFPRRVMKCDAICNTADRLGLSDNQVNCPSFLKLGLIWTN